MSRRRKLTRDTTSEEPDYACDSPDRESRAEADEEATIKSSGRARSAEMAKTANWALDIQ